MRVRAQVGRAALSMALAVTGCALAPAPAHAADMADCLRAKKVWINVDGVGAGCASAGTGEDVIRAVFGGGAITKAPNGIICKIAGYPGRNNCTYANNGWNAATQEYLVYWHYYPCENFPNGYAYRNVSVGCNEWNYSDEGAITYAAPAGSVEYWHYATTDVQPRLSVPGLSQPAPATTAPTSDAPPPANPGSTQGTDQGGSGAGDSAGAGSGTGADTQPGSTDGDTGSSGSTTADGPTTRPSDAPSAPAADAPSAEETPTAGPESATPTASPSAGGAGSAAPSTAPTSSAPVATAPATPVAPAGTGAESTTRSSSPLPTLLTLGGVAVLALGGGATWWWRRRRDS